MLLYCQAFNFDVTCIDWPHYLENYCLGVKKYVLKESLDTIEDARRALNRSVMITNRVSSFLLDNMMDRLSDAWTIMALLFSSRLYVIRRFVKVIGFFIMWCLIMPRLAIARRLWHYLISLAVKILHRIPGFARS